jgi:hypothetical protein
MNPHPMLTLDFDPARYYKSGSDSVRLFEYVAGSYQPMDTHVMQEIGLGYTLWKGEYKGNVETWLRWTDANGILFPTETEYRIEAFAFAENERQRANDERQRANDERQRADKEHQRANEERQRTQVLADKLRAMGINPDEI